MAEEKKNSFPGMPDAHWCGLRKKFQQSLPNVVTDNYLASVLDMQLVSARANVLPALKVAKIIDQDGKTLERAKQWRDDDQYAKVCEEIRSDIYPREPLDAIPDPLDNRQAAKRWFANYAGAGTSAVGKMVKFYSLLSQADPAKAQKRSKPPKATQPNSRENAPAKAPRNAVGNGQTMRGTVQNAQPEGQKSETPELHINLEIHISSDSSPDQIDQIFASMAKHIH
jgi:hypothetical protein